MALLHKVLPLAATLCLFSPAKVQAEFLPSHTSAFSRVMSSLPGHSHTFSVALNAGKGKTTKATGKSDHTTPKATSATASKPIRAQADGKASVKKSEKIAKAEPAKVADAKHKGKEPVAKAEPAKVADAKHKGKEPVAKAEPAKVADAKHKGKEPAAKVEPAKVADAKHKGKAEAKVADAKKAPVEQKVASGKNGKSTKNGKLLASAKGRKSLRAQRGRRGGAHVAAARDLPDGLERKVEAMIGAPYRLGGSAQYGTDCSGFVKSVMGTSGVNLPRTSAEQATMGHRVDRSHLKPGDLVFFDIRGRGSISHVGLYLGDDKMAHASPRQGVCISSLNEPYYIKRFVTARRVLD